VSVTHLFTLAPVRLAASRRDEEMPAAPVRSDTLMGALRAVSAETGVLARAFEGPAPPFVVSSVFLEAAGVRLYPRPRAEPAAFKGLDRWESEFFRRLWSSFEMVTEGRLESLAEGRRVRFEAEDIIEERAWGMPSERSLRGLPRTARGPAGSRLALSAEGRLFFLARLADPLLLAPLKELVARLGEAGLGSRRSTGWGQFTLAGVHAAPAFLQLESPAARNGDPLLLLSLYLPTREEVDRGVLDGMRGEAVVRGGWIHSSGPTTFKKRAVRCLAEGTVLPRPQGGVAGEVRDVRPAGFERHPVWLEGRALSIGYGGGG
jgi:CRISRP associated protein Csm4